MTLGRLWRPALAAAALVVLFVGVLYRALLPIAGGPHARLIYDSFDFAYPFVALVNRALRGGSWPSWNPFEYAGVPFWGNLQSLLFNPPTLLAAATCEMTLERFAVLQLAQVALGSLGMFLWVRARTGVIVAALAAAIGFAGCGAVVNLFSHYSLLSLFCLLPYPFAFHRRWLDTQQPRWLLATALAIACWLVTSYPSQLGYYCVAFSVYYFVTRYSRPRAERAPLGQELLLLGFVAPALASIHLLPALALLPQLSRGHGIPLALIRPRLAHPAQLFSIGLGSVATADGPYTTPDITLRDFHVGLWALFAAGYAVLGGKRSRWAMLAAALACCDLVLCRSLLLPLLHRVSPLTANSYYPSVEFGTLLCFLLLTLAGDGVADLARQPWSKRRLAGAAAALLLFLGGAAANPVLTAMARRNPDWPLRARTPAVFALACLAAAVLAQAFGRARGRKIALALLVVAAAGESWLDVTCNQKVMFWAATPAELTAQAAQYHAASRDYLDLLRRNHVARGGTWPNVSHANLVDGWRADGGYDSSTTRRTDAALADAAVRAVLLDPRPAFVADELRAVAEPQKVPLLQNGRVVAALPPDAPPLPEALDSPPARVIVTAYSLNRARYRVEALVPTLVVFNDLLLPGWRLRVDGREQPLSTANGYFRAARLPPGVHDCELRYWPPGASAGCVGAGLGLLVLVAWAAWRRRAQPTLK